jgi:glycine cleavage system H protein
MNNKIKLIPDGEVKCIWMNAGLVDYKLCDKSYNCDNCDFHNDFNKSSSDDLLIESDRNNNPKPAEISLFSFLDNYKLKEDVYYSKNHLWIQTLSFDRLLMGLDSFASSLLPKNISVVFSTPGTRVEQGKPFIWFTMNDTTLTIDAPLNGKIRENNQSFVKSGMNLNDSPYEKGWFYIFEPLNYKKEQRKLFRGWQMSAVCDTDKIKIKKKFHDAMRINEKKVGATMYDGGMPLTNLNDMLGDKKYIKIISSIL